MFMMRTVPEAEAEVQGPAPQLTHKSRPHWRREQERPLASARPVYSCLNGVTELPDV